MIKGITSTELQYVAAGFRGVLSMGFLRFRGSKKGLSWVLLKGAETRKGERE